MTLLEYANKIEAALDDCKNALNEQGVAIDKRPCLSDLPALIRAISTGVVPESYGIGTPGSITEHIAKIESTLFEIETALFESGVSTTNLKVSEIADKIREITTVCYMEPIEGAYGFRGMVQSATVVKFKNKLPSRDDTLMWEMGVTDLSVDQDKSVIMWTDYDDVTYVSAKGLGGTVVLPESLRSAFVATKGNNEKLISVEFENTDFSQVKDMYGMFENCVNLQSVKFNQPNTSQVTNMAYIFNKCASLETVDLDGMKTENVTDMESMFDECTSLKTLDLSSFDTSKVTTMFNMFWGSGLIKIDLSNFHTPALTDMRQLFSHCSDIAEIDVSNFDVSSVEEANGTFGWCNVLTTIYAQEWCETMPNPTREVLFDQSFSLPNYSEENVYATMAKWVEHGGYFTNPANKVDDTT